MTEAKHTPGPWEAVPTNRGTEVRAGENGYILTLTPRCRGVDNLDANARLIAAAPELLEAAEAALRLPDLAHAGHFGPDVVKQLRAAIARAKGEGSC